MLPDGHGIFRGFGAERQNSQLNDRRNDGERENPRPAIFMSEQLWEAEDLKKIRDILEKSSSCTSRNFKEMALEISSFK